MYKNIFSVAVFSLVLHGCFDQYERNKSVEERVMETKQTVSQKVRRQKTDPIPTVTGVTDNALIYLPQGRDPFIAMGVFGNLIKWGEWKDVAPQRVRIARDPSRPADYKAGPFEKYDIEQLTMIGVMSQPNGATAALIDVGNNRIMMVHKGDYIGKDHGLIKEITENKVLIDEKFSAATKTNPDAWMVLPNEIRLKIK